MGIDLRTAGTGRDVYAAADGYVSRIRCSPRGYGKAVYIHLEDGRTAVYAHLEAFNDRLTAYVRQAQHARQRYTVDLRPEPGALPVVRGEVIARSGQTGAGPPHLHYEIRNSAGHPINPRAAGAEWNDSTTPVIRNVLVVPASTGTRLNGNMTPLLLGVRESEPGRYLCDPVLAYGEIGFGLDVIDPSNNGANKLGIYSLSILAGAEVIFEVRNDRISYENSGDGVVAFHPFYEAEGPFLLGWRWANNACESFAHLGSDGWYTAPEHVQEVRLRATDFFGNSAEVVVPLVPDVPLPISSPLAPSPAAGMLSIEPMADWLLMTARFNAPVPDVPELFFEEDGRHCPGQFERMSDRIFQAGYAPGTDAQELAFRVAHPNLGEGRRRVLVFRRGAGDRREELGDVTVTVYSDSPYDTLFLWEGTPGPLPNSSIPILSKAYGLWPEEGPIDRAVELSFPMPPGAQRPERLRVFRKDDDEWSYESTERVGDRLTITTRRLGVFAIMDDDEPPRITDVTPMAVRADTKRPPIRARVSDIGTGIDDVTVTCNGAWLLMAYDPERDLLEWECDENLPEGPLELQFTATDRAGNETVLKHMLRSE